MCIVHIKMRVKRTCSEIFHTLTMKLIDCQFCKGQLIHVAHKDVYQTNMIRDIPFFHHENH